MDQHSSPFEQRMTLVDILRPEDDTCPVLSNYEYWGHFCYFSAFSILRTSSVPAHANKPIHSEDITTSSSEIIWRYRASYISFHDGGYFYYFLYFFCLILFLFFLGPYVVLSVIRSLLLFIWLDSESICDSFGHDLILGQVMYALYILLGKETASQLIIFCAWLSHLIH